jgi:inorganic triphosphatase YgiF
MAKALPVNVRADDSFADAARETLAVRAPELLLYREGTLRGEDIEQLHSLRVSTRRLRAALEVYGVCFPAKQHRRLLALVKDTADAMSPARDLDVQIDHLERYAAEAPAADRPGVQDLIGRLRREREAANAVIAPALGRLDEERFLERAAKLVGRDLTAPAKPPAGDQDGSATSADGADAAPPGLIPGEGVARAGERSEVTA